VHELQQSIFSFLFVGVQFTLTVGAVPPISEEVVNCMDDLLSEVWFKFAAVDTQSNTGKKGKFLQFHANLW